MQRFPAYEPVYTCYGRKIKESSSGLAVLFLITRIGNNSELKPTPKPQWFPYSQITKNFTDPSRKQPDYIICKEWILKQKGFLNDDFQVEPNEVIETSGVQDTSERFESEPGTSFDPPF